MQTSMSMTSSIIVSREFHVLRTESAKLFDFGVLDHAEKEKLERAGDSKAGLYGFSVSTFGFLKNASGALVGTVLSPEVSFIM